MVRRTKRLFSEADQERFIAAIDACRNATIAVMTVAPIHGTAYQSASKLSAALDEVQERLTGQKNLFGMPGHSTHTNCFGPPKGKA